MSVNGFDIIGDIHGCALTLERLLTRLGYTNAQGYFAHPTRRAIFLGDIIDRGPRVREALHLVKNMVDEGAAKCILGNHEYNAVGYTTRVGDGGGSNTCGNTAGNTSDNTCDHENTPVYVRPHTEHNKRLISETLAQFASYPEEWRMFLNWFRTLPLFIEFDDFRVVHACWDQFFVDKLLVKNLFSGGGASTIDEAFVLASANKDSFEAKALERLARGTDLYLPEGRSIKSNDGITRRSFRTKFWVENPQTYSDVIFQPDPLPDDLMNRPLADVERERLVYYSEKEKPLFVGHYWLKGKPVRQAKNIACLDYSAVKYGCLVAYRFDGEQEIDNDKFVWEEVNP